MSEKECAIGVFDSGIGGLTTVAELKRVMPHENIVYFGDTGRVPYGTRSRETVIKYAKQDMAFLLSHDVKMVIAACNTISVVLTDEIKQTISSPFLEVLTPAVHAAAAATKTGRIGIIGTYITVGSGAYERELLKINHNFEITAAACPLFVPLVENGFTERGNEVTTLVAKQYLAPLIAAKVDVLILGCTHYPIIKGIISDIMGESVTLIDSGAEVAKVAKAQLEENGALNENGGDCSYYVSDSTEGFLKLSSNIFGNVLNIASAQQVDIENIYIG